MVIAYVTIEQCETYTSNPRIITYHNHNQSPGSFRGSCSITGCFLPSLLDQLMIAKFVTLLNIPQLKWNIAHSWIFKDMLLRDLRCTMICSPHVWLKSHPSGFKFNIPSLNIEGHMEKHLLRHKYRHGNTGKNASTPTHQAELLPQRDLIAAFMLTFGNLQVYHSKTTTTWSWMHQIINIFPNITTNIAKTSLHNLHFEIGVFSLSFRPQSWWHPTKKCHACQASAVQPLVFPHLNCCVATVSPPGKAQSQPFVANVKVPNIPNVLPNKPWSTWESTCKWLGWVGMNILCFKYLNGDCKTTLRSFTICGPSPEIHGIGWKQ